MKQVYFILFAILLSGCDLFTTRSAQPPNQARSDYQQPVTWNLVVSNLVSSLQDLNVQNYLSCLSDSTFAPKNFTFSASSSALSQYPQLSDNWDKSDEQLYLYNIVNKISSNLYITLTLSNTSYTAYADSVVYSASYTLNVPTTDPSIPQNYQGTLIFHIIENSQSVWSIYYWQDSKSSSSLPSWSDLKGKAY
jgi:hypothetical protein